MSRMNRGTPFQRDDTVLKQKPPSYMTVERFQPLNVPMPTFQRKAGIKRKSSGLPQISGETKIDNTATRHSKRACVRAMQSKPVNPLLSLKDELEWLRQQEMKPHMRLQPWPAGDQVWENCDVTKQQRADVIDWVMVIHLGMNLEKNTLFVAVNLLDRFIQNGRVSKKALRPIALSCLWIAAKMADHYHKVPKEWLLMKLLGPSHTLEEFRLCERMVLRSVGFNLWRPTALQFAEKYAAVLKPELAGAIREKMHSALELCLRDEEMSFKNPSEVGISCLSYALGLQTDSVAARLKDISTYNLHDLHDMVVNICNAAYNTLQLKEADPIFNKYRKAFDTENNIYLRFRTMACKE